MESPSDLRNKFSRAVLSVESLDWDGFLTSESSWDRCERVIMLQETRIEPSFIRIGQKMGSVDQKMLKIDIGSFSDKVW